jgi:hypothetical protein
MDGTPFGLSGAVNENTFTGGTGTSTIRGSLKYARSNSGAAAGIRAGGYWWSKPWMGELCPDSAYATQWATWGNLRAATGTGAGTFRLIRRADVPTAQQPRGTTLVNAQGLLSEEGCTSLFNVGTSSSTFHHQYQNGGTGSLTEDGPQLATNYQLSVPTSAPISRPFGIATNASGGVGPEFNFTDAYPRHSAAMVRRFYGHSAGQTGSGLVRLTEPGTGGNSAFFVVNGLDRTTSSGSAFIARYAVVSVLHGYFAAGAPGLPNRIRQVPMVMVTYPTLSTELRNPASVPVRWTMNWRRWDDKPYTAAYPSTFAEATADLYYVLLLSRDEGATWTHMLDGSPATPGTLPLNGAGVPDPAKVYRHAGSSNDQAWTWNTPAGSVPAGPYLIRIEAFRSSEPLHYAHHMEKVYVDR